VARKHKPRKPAPQTPAALRSRVERASSEGRFQQALELAKQLHKQDPTPANKDLLRAAYLGRARQLRTTGYTRDAVTVLNAALQIDRTDPAWLGRVAAELAAAGDPRQALAVAAPLPPDSPARASVLALVADAAVQLESAGRAALPPELQADFDRVVAAFAHVEAGQDEQAREALQAVGLRSPFLEWKVLLRGLIAFYQKDDARALENWQRLDADRLPARLVAPYRFLIDPAFRAAQAPPAQAALQRQADRLAGQDLVRRLREVQAALTDQRSLARAFRLAEDLLPALRTESPAAAARLAACFYWGAITDGGPDDIPRYRRVFGPPPDDPTFARMRAVAYERAGELEQAHQQWQDFERAVAAHPQAWPGEQAARVRALVWKHMGTNAAAVPETNRLPLPPYFRDHAARALKPGPEECFRKSLELADDQLETHEELVHYYLEHDKSKKAEQAARQLLKRFADHVPTLEALSELRVQAQDYPEGIDLLRRALKANPLDRRLRERLGTAHTLHARHHAEGGRFEAARAEFQAALALAQADGRSLSSVYCKMAACEFKAGDAAKAEELLEKARSEAGSRLAVAYSMLIEAIRLKLPAKLKTRFNKDFNALLAEPPDGATAAAIAQTAAVHQAAGVTYHGQKTHEKKVLAYLKKALGAQPSEEQTDRVCAALLGLKAHPLLRDYAELGQRRFPANPYFLFYEAEACVLQGLYRRDVPRVRHLLGEVRRLAADLPPDARKQALLETVQRREETVAVSPFDGLGLPDFPDFFDDMFDDDEDEDDDGYW
jgi:tetratricopeptide (TPR) repeat protein